MASVNTITCIIQRCRQQHNPNIAHPTVRADIVLSDVLCTTNDNEEFLLHGSGGGDKRHLMFGTKKKIWSSLHRVNSGSLKEHLRRFHIYLINCTT